MAEGRKLCPDWLRKFEMNFVFTKLCFRRFTYWIPLSIEGLKDFLFSFGHLPIVFFLWRYLATYAILIISLFELCSNTQNMNQPLSLHFDGFRLNASLTEFFSFPFSSSLYVNNKNKNIFLPVTGHDYGT